MHDILYTYNPYRTSSKDKRKRQWKGEREREKEGESKRARKRREHEKRVHSNLPLCNRFFEEGKYKVLGCGVAGRDGQRFSWRWCGIRLNVGWRIVVAGTVVIVVVVVVLVVVPALSLAWAIVVKAEDAKFDIGMVIQMSISLLSFVIHTMRHPYRAANR